MHEPAACPLIGAGGFFWYASKCGAWEALPAATSASCGGASLAPLPLAGGAGGGTTLSVAAR